MIERVTFTDEDGKQHRYLLKDARRIFVLGKEFLHGKQVTPKGYLVTAPWSYTERHPPGDGMVWRMIPTASITHITNLENANDGLPADEPGPAGEHPSSPAVDEPTAGSPAAADLLQ